MPEGQVLEFTDVTKRFNTVTAVSGLSVRVEPGAVTGLLGPNGAGKTTSLRILLGQIRPTSGTATIGGVPYNELRQPLRTVGSVLEESVYRPRRTATRQLMIAAKANGIPVERVAEVLHLVGLQDDADTRLGSYSLGMRQRLSVANALLGDPGVLVLDEPANGLDPEGIRWMRLLMRRLADEGRTVLVSSHVLSEIEQVADNVVVLSRGRAVYSGSMDELADPAGGAVVVDADDRIALVAALTSAGLTFDLLRSGVTVRNSNAAQVGAIAAESGIALTTLQQRGPSLEEVFLDLVYGRRADSPRLDKMANPVTHAGDSHDPTGDAALVAGGVPLAGAAAVIADGGVVAAAGVGYGTAPIDVVSTADADENASDADADAGAVADADADAAPAEQVPAGDEPAGADAPDEARAADLPAEEAAVADTPAVDAATNGLPFGGAPDGQAPEVQSDEARADNAAGDEAPADETPSHEAPADETPADEAPADEAPADEAQADEAPADEAQAEQAPGEQELTDNHPADNTAADNAAADEAPADEPRFSGAAFGAAAAEQRASFDQAVTSAETDPAATAAPANPWAPQAADATASDVPDHDRADESDATDTHVEGQQADEGDRPGVLPHATDSISILTSTDVPTFSDLITGITSDVDAPATATEAITLPVHPVIHDEDEDSTVDDAEDDPRLAAMRTSLSSAASRFFEGEAPDYPYGRPNAAEGASADESAANADEGQDGTSTQSEHGEHHHS